MQKLNRWFKELKRWKKIILFGTLFFSIWYVFALPKILFKDKYTTVLLDRNGELLGAKISDDGQWDFLNAIQYPKN
jgi:penicillin-binding protein 1C